MSLGITGAMDPGGRGDLSIHYAVASTYLVSSGWVNKITATCKRCGRDLPKGEGRKTMICGGGPRPTEAYFCQPCVDWVGKSRELVAERQIEDARGRKAQPPKED